MSSSEIQRFYKNQTIFVTGATGLVGKQLVRKLLDSCTDLRKIYVLMREKKERTVEQRMSYFLSGLKVAASKDLEEKICAISGDCSLPRLGIKEADWKMLSEEVNVIIHSSATVKFDESIRIAGKINTKSVWDVLQLARETQSLTAFVYVSTAFSNNLDEFEDEIKEQFYDPPMAPESFLEMIDSAEDVPLDDSKTIGKWPNTYTFTKALAENIVKTHACDLPAAIVRPCIVWGAAKDPEPGLLDKFQGLMMLLVGCYLGVIHTIKTKLSNNAPIVPSDYVVNNILAVAWDVNSRGDTGEAPIYNFTGSKKNLTDWYMLRAASYSFTENYPSEKTVWYQFFIYTHNELLYRICCILFHTVPAYAADFILLLLGKKRQAVDVLNQINAGLELVKPFSEINWKFETGRVERLWEKMNAKDRELFLFNMDDLDWPSYLENVNHYARRHLLKEPIDTVEKAKRKAFYLKLLNYLVATLFLCVVYFGIKSVLIVVQYALY